MAQRLKLMALMEGLELVEMGFGSLCMVVMKAQIILEYGLQSLIVCFFYYCLWNLSLRLATSWLSHCMRHLKLLIIPKNKLFCERQGWRHDIP